MPYFRHRSHLPQSADTVFSWHTRPGALERLIPPWMDARVVERKGGIADGGRVLLRVRHGPTEFKWEARHTAFEEGRMFRDEQVSGPFQKWIHTHRFIPADDGGCFMEDEVEWGPPMGTAALLVAEGFIEKELTRLYI